MSPLEPSNLATAGPEKLNITEAQDKDFKKAIINRFKVLKEDRNKLIIEIYKNTNSAMK